MAQNYRDEEGRKEDFSQEPSDPSLSGSDYTGKGFQGRKSQEQLDDPDYVPTAQEKLDDPDYVPTAQEQLDDPDYAPTGERNSGYPPSGGGKPIDGTYGPTSEGQQAFDAGQEGHGAEDRYAEWGRDDGKAGDAAGIGAPEQNAGGGAPAMDEGFEQSPYIQHDSKLDYNKRGYGGEGYAEPQDDEEPPTVHEPKGEPHEQESEPVHDSPKETIIHKLIPCHKTQTLEDDQQQQHGDEAPKKAGFVEKIKEKLTGKSHPEATSPHGEAGYGDLQPTN